MSTGAGAVLHRQRIYRAPRELGAGEQRCTPDPSLWAARACNLPPPPLPLHLAGLHAAEFVEVGGHAHAHVVGPLGVLAEDDLPLGGMRGGARGQSRGDHAHPQNLQVTWPPAGAASCQADRLAPPTGHGLSGR
jgi:hypothetical protein